MLTAKLTRATLGFVLASVALLGLTAAARADESSVPPAGVRQAGESAKQQALAKTAPPSSSSSAEGAAGDPHPTGEQPAQPEPKAAGEQPAQPEPKAAASAPGLTGESPPSHAQATGTDISEAVKQAIGQASTKQPQEAVRVEQGSPVAASSATAQLIWQLQVSQCTSGCYGTKQYQSAEQHDTTRQQITTASAPGGDQGAPVTGERSQAASSVTQIQFGCLFHCFGTTATTQPPLTSYGQVLADLLRQITTALSGLGPAPAAEQRAVQQVSFQSQNAAGGAVTQVQGAVQSSATIQAYASSPPAGPAPELGGSQTPSGEVVNQTEQGIWQLQIGCLFLCHETAQYQRAEQSNATLQTILPAAGSAANVSASASDIVAQDIWQVQIGCLSWCFDATEQQIGTTRNDLTVTHGEGAAAPGPPQAISNSPGSENETGPRPGTAGSQALPEAHAPPPGGPHGGIGAPAPPLATLPTSTARVRERAAILSEASPATAGSHRRRASPARFTAARRPARRGALRGDAPAGFATQRAYRYRPAGVPVRAVARGLPPAFGAVGAGAAFASPGRTAPGPVGVLLAVIALCGVGCLRIAAIRTRRGWRARHQGRLTSE
jgi:hypothetical protein